MTIQPLGKNIQNTFSPPVMEARRWLEKAVFPADRPLLNLSQAAPVDPPPLSLREAMAGHVFEDDSHLYGPVLGLPALRAEIAAQWSDIYGGDIHAEDVAITSGCNQAFCAAISAVASAGDAVILPTPWYFNHKMWLDMAGIEARLLPCGDGMVPDPAAAEALLDDKVKAIILVTPNNPTGAEYPDGVLHGFARLARKHKLALIIDETYRDFHSMDGPPHTLFSDPDWRNEIIHLYSFSKVYHLTGHRVGAMVTSPERLAQAEKFLDSVAICPNPLGQKAALFGLHNLTKFVSDERLEILRRKEIVEDGFKALPGWKLLQSGAYFAFVEHPFDLPSDIVAQRLVAEQSLLILPGTMFGPTKANGGDGSAEKQLRIAFANADSDGLATLFARLRAFTP
ncbi:MAG: aminotransferase [Rhodobacteraceae bacterium]|nr:aminotransferase [Paracoccaceae bacterium]